MSMYLSILREKIVRIGRDEDGAALVVTLAIFMFMYLLCIGVYATGTAVKQRIHLQNACDAAAYSAAVVQADTLSRIATINRAMSWTYAQMTRRQMDYIAYKWLKHTSDHYTADRAVAEAWHLGSTPLCPLGHGSHPNGWFIGSDGLFDNIRLNGWRHEHRTTISSACTYFNTVHMNLPANHPSFYEMAGGVSFSELTRQIASDKEVIGKMNEKERKLARDLSGRIEDCVRDVIDANIPQHLKGKYTKKCVQVCANPLVDENPEGYLIDLHDNNSDELRFLRFGDDPGSRTASVRAAFDTGIDNWFVHAGASKGLQRTYRQAGATLSSAWSWWSGRWTCYYVPPTEVSPGYWVHPVVYYSGICPHPGCVDTCRKSGNWYSAELRAGDLRDDQYLGGNARPLVMQRNYFGKDGTISVGLACRNENPWAPILGAISQGIFSAFNPFTEWTVCFASAKAGYKRQLGAAPSTRNYRIDWNGIEDWNLCQSDWDAVLIPVRMARSQAEGGKWSEAGRFLADWVFEVIGSDERIRAGGLETPEEVDQYVQAWNELEAGSPSHSHAVTARWQIGTPNAKVGWNQLTDRMFH